MRASRWVGPVSASCIIACCSAAGLAQDGAAEALFNRGLAQMEAGEYDQGCPAIGESYRLDPRPGALFTLAECEAKRGRIATAFMRYGEYLALFARLPPERQARQRGRDRIALEQRAALGPRVPEITLVLPPGTPRGTVLKRDGMLLADAEFGRAFPIDPGEHVITIELPGKPPRELRLSIAASEKKQILLDEAPPDARRSSPTAGVPGRWPSLPTPPGGAKPRTDWRLPVGITAVGLGAVSLITGIVASFETKRASDDLIPVRRLAPTVGNVCATGFQPRPSSGFTQSELTAVCSRGNAFEAVQLITYPLVPLFVGAGAFFLASRPRTSPTVTVVPTLGPGHASMSVGARF